MELFKYLYFLTELKYPCLNKLMSKHGRTAALIFLYTLYKAGRMSELSFFHSFLAFFPLLMMQQVSSFIL